MLQYHRSPSSLVHLGWRVCGLFTMHSYSFNNVLVYYSIGIWQSITFMLECRGWLDVHDVYSVHTYYNATFNISRAYFTTNPLYGFPYFLSMFNSIPCHSNIWGWSWSQKNSNWSVLFLWVCQECQSCWGFSAWRSDSVTSCLFWLQLFSNTKGAWACLLIYMCVQ